MIFFYFQFKQFVFAMKVVEKIDAKIMQFSLHIDACFEKYKQSANKLSETCQSKVTLHHTKSQKGDGWLFQMC